VKEKCWLGKGENGVHKEGDGEGPSGDAGVQPVLPP